MEIEYKDKINIESIKDDRAYQVVARLVDNEEVLLAIKRLRNWLGLKDLMSYEGAKQWLKDPKNIKQRVYLGLRISGIKEKYNFDYSFDSVMLLAILAGKVTKEEYTYSAYCIEFPPENMDLATDYISRVAIVIGPDTTTEEVNLLMKTKAKGIFRELKAKQRSPIRIREEFRNARKWYWLKKKMTYPELYEYVNRNKFVSDEDAIKKAVINYRKKIK